MRRLFLVTNMLVFMYSSALFAQKKPLELLENRNMEVLDQKVTDMDVTDVTASIPNSSEGVVLDVDNLKSKYTYKVLSIYGDVLSEGSSTEKTSLVLPRGKELGNPFVIISILDGNTPKNFKINTNLYE